MHGQVLPQAWWELKSAPKMNGSFPSLVIKHTSCIKLALISLRKPTRRDISCKKQNLPNHDTYDFPANRDLVQRTPVSSVHMDRGLETERVRTSASTPALVPLFAVLIAALPVLAHANVFASLAAVTSFSLSKWVSEMRAASKADVRMLVLGVATPSCHVALEDIHHTLGNLEFTFLASVLASSSFPRDDKRGCCLFFLLPRVHWTKICMDMVKCTRDDVDEARQMGKHRSGNETKSVSSCQPLVALINDMCTSMKVGVANGRLIYEESEKSPASSPVWYFCLL